MNWKSLVLLSVLLAPLPAAAQGWREYSNPGGGFTVTFPAPPAATAGAYTTTTGTTVPAAIYTARQNNLVFIITVADFSKTNLGDQDAIADAVKAAAAEGVVKADVDSRISNKYGRELTVDGKDASRSIYAIFFFNHRLYELRGIALPPDAVAGSGSLIRFQQSLQFSYY